MMVILWRFAVFISIVILSLSPNICLGHRKPMNVIDKCWRLNPNWRKNRYQLASCSVGFAGKMTNNVGKDLIPYEVTDPSDNPLNPKPGTLRYGATVIPGKVWITFQKDMNIKLKKPLLISSFTAIDGRGAEVHIANNGCLLVYEATDVIIHGLNIHHCKAQEPSKVMAPDGEVKPIGREEGDAIRLVSASRVWIDHNTLYSCKDGLLDATLGSTNITISNNRFKDQDKVMLLGHNDDWLTDKKMRVTLAYNHFGPNCNQRMPRVRHGYVHLANNLYEGWAEYAIGGSMKPRILSEANDFAASESGNKEVTWKNGFNKNIYSVGDLLENGASFEKTGRLNAKPKYNIQQWFRVAKSKHVRSITSSSGSLKCSNSRC